MEPVPCQLYRRIFVSCSRSHLKPPRTNKCADSRDKTPYKSTGTLRLQGLFAYAGRGLSFPPTRQNAARVIKAINYMCTYDRTAWMDNIKTWTGLSWKSQSEWQRTGIHGESTSMVWPTLGSRTSKEQNRTERNMYDRLLEPWKEVKTIIFYTCF